MTQRRAILNRRGFAGLIGSATAFLGVHAQECLPRDPRKMGDQSQAQRSRLKARCWEWEPA